MIYNYSDHNYLFPPPSVKMFLTHIIPPCWPNTMYRTYSWLPARTASLCHHFLPIRELLLELAEYKTLSFCLSLLLIPFKFLTELHLPHLTLQLILKYRSFSENIFLFLISCSNLMHSLFIIFFSYSSTCFEPHFAHHQEGLLFIYTESGSFYVTLFRWPFSAQVVRGVF